MTTPKSKLIWVFALCLVVGLLTVAVTYRSPGQPTLLANHHYAVAAWFRGHSEPPLLTYPMWGYGFLLAWLPLAAVKVLSVCAAAAASTALYAELRHLPSLNERVLRWGLVLALPWYVYCGVSWPDGLSFALLTGALAGFAHSLRAGGWRGILAAALCLGLGAQLRSEVLLMGLGLTAVTAVLSLSRPSSRLKSLLVVPVLTLFMVPWMAHYWQATGHISPMSSNGGAVAWITLGELPNNPWGLVAADEQATQTLESLGVQTQAFSHEGGATLRHQWTLAIAEHPGAFTRKVLGNAALVGVGGFFVGELPFADPLAIDRARDQLKALAGRGAPPLSANTAPTGLFAQLGLALSVGWVLLGVVWGDLMVAAIALGGGLVLMRHRHPALVLLTAVIAAQWCMVALLQYHPRHVTVFAIWGVPYVALLVTAAQRRWRR